MADSDVAILRQIHETNGLPENCFPDLADPLFLVKNVVEQDGKPVMASFLKGTSEIFLIVDHSQGTPEERWAWLCELKEVMVHEAWLRGLSEMTAWIPPEIEKGFAKRLEGLGFCPSAWRSYTLRIPDQM